jgi:hypothetical protein
MMARRRLSEDVLEPWRCYPHSERKPLMRVRGAMIIQVLHGPHAKVLISSGTYATPAG